MENNLNVITDVSHNVIEENDNLKYALEQLDKISVKVLLVINNNKSFVAAITDGDVRRAILGGASLETAVLHIANYHPYFLKQDNEEEAKKILIEKDISAIPVLDDKYKIQKIYVIGEGKQAKNAEKLQMPVIIMAGGLGTRLYPYTKILPKPLIPVSDVPISERIIESFFRIGCKDFHMIVNYKRNMIKAYFNDMDHDYNIHFWDEETPLGTGGGLRLLQDSMKETFVLTNCDILVLDDVRKIVKHHKEEQNKVTMVCSLKNFTIPYGIVNFSEGGEISSFEEKPQLSFFTNTGYYILEPDVFRYINQGEKIGMPDVIDRMRMDGLKVGIYPIGEKAWLDMGQFDSMESMERNLKELKIF